MNEEKKKTLFETKILPVLNYVGAIGAGILSIAYLILVGVLINGFKAEKILQTTIFAVVSAGIGFVIMQFLKYQGISFAEMIEENKALLERYHLKTAKVKKHHSLNYFWITTGIKDILVKCLTLAATSIGVVYIIIKGSHDYGLILLALVNLFMFICFGFLSLVKAYKYFNNTYIPYIKDQLEKEN